MKHQARNQLICLAVVVLLSAVSAQAQFPPTSDLLLPYFEVDLDGAGTTLFAVVNTSDEEVEVSATLHTNWGIAMLDSKFVLEPHEVKTVNLASWLVKGTLPDRDLAAREIDHVQAAFCGQRSPEDDKFYSTEKAFRLAVGYVALRTVGRPRPDVLIGDYFVVDPSQDFAQGQVLIDIDPAARCPGLCERHALRFLAGGGFDSGTEIIIWTPREGESNDDGNFPEDLLVASNVLAFNEAGQTIDSRQLDFLAVEVIKVSELGLSEAFGWLDILTEEASFITVRYSASNRYSVGLKTFCLPLRQAGIRIEKRTNGVDADRAPGPTIAIGAPVEWSYQVTNIGDTPLTDVVVTDDQGVDVSCSKSTLEPGESMDCTGSGTAEACQYSNIGRATGFLPDGSLVEDSDSSHYLGRNHAAIDIETYTDSQDSDSGPGQVISVGDEVSWTYRVENTGDEALLNIVVTDDQGVDVSCPQTSLAAGQSMTCTASGTATSGLYKNLGTVTATTGGSCPETVSDSDPSHYTGEGECSANPSIEIEKSTNGQDADYAPGLEIEAGGLVTWEYRVENTGDVPLSSISVTDDQEGTVSCSKTSLAPGASMTCTIEGTAVLGEYANLGTVTATSGGSCSATVSDSDPSHYTGVELPPPPPPAGNQGCTPGYWKQTQHADSWEPAGYSTDQLVKSVFGDASAYPQGLSTLLGGLGFGGNGSGIEASVKKLLRASVAGLLNAAHPDVNYPRTEGDLIAAVDQALDSGDSATMLELKDEIDQDNNGGCPLN